MGPRETGGPATGDAPYLLTVDVGNTHTVLGVHEGPAMMGHWRMATDPDRTVDEVGADCEADRGTFSIADSPAWATWDAACINDLRTCWTRPVDGDAAEDSVGA